ncbi:hypothetical protein RchiOBHm_Chr1g0346411 [Rosa chinensis]|uniref:Uncharacterized protein n=1 Tax=Rosa chinensis TaxID=74649 RepID=A0A2P6SF06_ROSCH|nr:hypothetical protein RchiOBHm_Chr1g0346411 [Rosa chinensis]
MDGVSEKESPYTFEFDLDPLSPRTTVSHSPSDLLYHSCFVLQNPQALSHSWQLGPPLPLANPDNANIIERFQFPGVNFVFKFAVGSGRRLKDSSCW